MDNKLESWTENNWTNFLYLVAIPSGKLAHEATRIQGVLAESLQIYGSMPPPIHITLCTLRNVETSELDNVVDVVEEVLASKPFLPFSVEAYDFDCLTVAHNSLILKITEAPLLAELQSHLQMELSKKSYLIPPRFSTWLFHITIISKLFASSPLSDEDFKKVCHRISLRETPLPGHINTLELWRPSLIAKERNIKSFYL